MAKKSSRLLYVFVGVFALAVGSVVGWNWYVSISDDSSEPVAVSQPVGDIRPLAEMLEVRFGELTIESVRQECQDWVDETEWVPLQTLSEIYAAGSGTSNAAVEQDFRAFRESQVEQYDKITQDDQAIRSVVKGLLSIWAEYGDGGTPDNRRQLKEAAVKAVAAGSGDPLVKLMQLVSDVPDDYTKVEASIAELPGLLSDAGYDISFRLLAQHRRFHIATANEAVNLGAIAELLIDDAVTYAEAYSSKPKLARVAWYAIFTAFRPPLRQSEQEEFLRRILISDKVDPLFQHLLVGYWYREKAARLRGGGFIDTVPEDARAEIRHTFLTAAMHQQKAWLLRPDLPQAATALVELASVVSKHGHWPSRIWFELSCRAQFDYMPAYQKLLIRLQPRYGGTYLHMVDFGKECASTEAFETSVPFFLVDCVKQIARETPGGATWGISLYVDALTDFWKSLDAWGDKNGADRTTAQWQQHYSLQAAVMIRNERYEEARQALQKAAWPPSKHAMGDVVADPMLSASMAYALSEPDSDSLVKLERKYGSEIPETADESDLTEALATLKKASDQVSQPRAKRYFSVRGHSLRQQLAFLRGEEVALEFDEPLTAWTVKGGEATVESPTSLLMTNMGMGPSDMQAIPAASFSAPYVVTATLERIRGTHWFPRLGINVGSVSQANMLSKPGGMVFMFDDQPRVAGTMVVNGVQPQVYYVPGLQDAATLMVKVWPDHYEMSINGSLIPLQPVSIFRSKGNLTFGGNPYEGGMGAIRLSDASIQRLSEE